MYSFSNKKNKNKCVKELITAIKVNIASVSFNGLFPISHSLHSFTVFSDSGSQRGADKNTSVIIGRGVVGG